jgi:tellurite resistance protein
VTKRVDLVADLLMGAAHADQELSGKELDTVKKLLGKVIKRSRLPDWLEWRIEDFKAAHLDIAEAVGKLGLKSKDEKHKLLEMVVAVHESDDTWDLDEDAYLHDVAGALGLNQADYDDITVAELEIESIAKLVVPPPLPKT